MILARLMSRTHDNTEMKTICDIKLPLPPKELQPNARPHWRAKAKAVQSYRAMALHEALQWNTDECCSVAVVKIEYANKTKRVLDPDNIIAALKSAIDGITSSGCIEDDDELIYLPPKRYKCAEDPHVRITLLQPNEMELDAIEQLFEMD